MTNHKQNYITIKQARERLKASRNTIINMIKEGKIAAFKINESGNSSWRINEDSFNEYLASRILSMKHERNKEINNV